jgi:hypothetical protein
MSDLVFFVKEFPEGGYTARALGASIFTQADDWPTLQARVRDAVLCHFDEGQAPYLVRLKFDRADEAAR